MTSTTEPDQADLTDLVRALSQLGGRSGLLLPLADTGGDGDCHTPAFYDRATNVWRHLNTLSQCQRPTGPPQTGDRRGLILSCETGLAGRLRSASWWRCWYFSPFQ